MRAIALAAMIAVACGGGRDRDESDIRVELATTSETDDRATADDEPAPAGWPGARTADRDPAAGSRVTVAAAAGAAGAAPTRAAADGADCGRIVDHVYRVLANQMPAARTAEARDREASDRDALARMCPARATRAFETCVLAQRTIEDILSCDPITGARDSAASALLKQALGQVELPDTPDGVGDGALPQPIDLPDPPFSR